MKSWMEKGFGSIYAAKGLITCGYTTFVMVLATWFMFNAILQRYNIHRTYKHLIGYFVVYHNSLKIILNVQNNINYLVHKITAQIYLRIVCIYQLIEANLLLYPHFLKKVRPSDRLSRFTFSNCAYILQTSKLNSWSLIWGVMLLCKKVVLGVN